MFKIVTLEEVKLYLKIDFNDEDEVLKQMIDTSELYLYNLTGKVFSDSNITFDLISVNYTIQIFNKFEEKLAKLYINAMVNELYNNRTLTCEKADKTVYIFQSILNQLRY